MQRLLIAVASLAAETGSRHMGSVAQQCMGFAALPGPGTETLSLHWQADSLPLDYQVSPLLLF